MEELILLRTNEKDYKSLEDQIRCLRTRYENLGVDHENEVIDLENQGDQLKHNID